MNYTFYNPFITHALSINVLETVAENRTDRQQDDLSNDNVKSAAATLVAVIWETFHIFWKFQTEDGP